MSETEDLALLLARCALRDRNAFAKLYRASSAQLFGIVLRIVNNHDMASDVLQEGFVKIWQRADDFQPDRAKPITWMTAIMRNQAIDILRRNVHHGHWVDIDEAPLLADEAADHGDVLGNEQQYQQIHRCLKQLEENQQRAIRLAYFEGLTHELLARRLNAPLGTVKSWIRRGLLRLKHCLKEHQ